MPKHEVALTKVVDTGSSNVPSASSSWRTSISPAISPNGMSSILFQLISVFNLISYFDNYFITRYYAALTIYRTSYVVWRVTERRPSAVETVSWLYGPIPKEIWAGRNNQEIWSVQSTYVNTTHTCIHTHQSFARRAWSVISSLICWRTVLCLAWTNSQI